MTVAIIVPNTGTVHHNTVTSLTGLVWHTAKEACIPVGLEYHSPSIAGLAKVRNLGAELALANPNVTHTLWVDSDMTFPPDALDRLLKWDKPIVGCAYSKRDGSSIVAAGMDGKQMTSIPKHGLHEVKVLGFGLILIQRSVFEKAEQPWFYEPYIDGYGPVGEDAYFLLEAGAKGFKTMMDATLSREVGHLGTMEYKL